MNVLLPEGEGNADGEIGQAEIRLEVFANVADFLDGCCYVFRVVEIDEEEGDLRVSQGSGFGDFEIGAVGGGGPWLGRGMEVGHRVGVGQSVVGHPRREIIVEGFGVDDAGVGNQSYFSHLLLDDRIVRVTRLLHYFVS